MSDDFEKSDGLGSLSQAARTKSLKSAQRILIIIGALYLIIFTGIFAMTEKLVDAEIEKEKKALGPGMVFDPVKMKEIRSTLIKAQQLYAGAFVAASVIMIVLGICVYKAPVLCTVLGLVFFLAAWLVPIVLSFLGDSTEDVAKAIWGGIIFKVLVIVALVKAIQSAIAYQNENKSLAAQY